MVKCSQEKEKGTKERFRQENDQIWSTKETLGWLPRTWIPYQIKHCTWHTQAGWENSQDNYVWKNIWHKPILWFEWFDWLMSWDKMASYLDDHFKLGRYLGPSIDVGLAMTAKIWKENGQILHKSTHQALTWDEWDRDKCKDKCRFMESVN